MFSDKALNVISTKMIAAGYRCGVIMDEDVEGPMLIVHLDEDDEGMADDNYAIIYVTYDENHVGIELNQNFGLIQSKYSAKVMQKLLEVAKPYLD